MQRSDDGTDYREYEGTHPHHASTESRAPTSVSAPRPRDLSIRRTFRRGHGVSDRLGDRTDRFRVQKPSVSPRRGSPKDPTEALPSTPDLQGFASPLVAIGCRSSLTKEEVDGSRPFRPTVRRRTS